jgi:LemA protein
MKKFGCLGILAVAVVLALVLGVWAVGVYNKLVNLDQEVAASWSQVENQYQRRLDLLPNMVEVVKRYAQHEQQVFKDLADARARYAGAPSGSTEKMQAATQLDGVLGRLMVIVENYPNLKANEQFTRLMDQWEGTENRIAVERQRYNDQVKAYNMTAMSAFGRLWVGLFGFDRSKSYYQAASNAAQAPSAKEMFGPEK